MTVYEETNSSLGVFLFRHQMLSGKRKLRSSIKLIMPSLKAHTVSYLSYTNGEEDWFNDLKCPNVMKLD